MFDCVIQAFQEEPDRQDLQALDRWDRQVFLAIRAHKEHKEYQVRAGFNENLSALRNFFCLAYCSTVVCLCVQIITFEGNDLSVT